MSRRAPADRDRGSSLLEMVITVSIMSVFMTVFTTGMIQMYRAANQNQAVADAQTQVHVAFLRLDKQVRYATGISAVDPALAYVEFLTTNTGTGTCTELRVAGRLLQSRSWPQGGAPVTGSWATLASGVSAGTPFTREDPSPTQSFQRLRLRLTVTEGGSGHQVTRATDITFTALNTSLATTSDDDCTEGRTVP